MYSLEVTTPCSRLVIVAFAVAFTSCVFTEHMARASSRGPLPWYVAFRTSRYGLRGSVLLIVYAGPRADDGKYGI